MFPFNGSVSRRLASLGRISRGSILRLRRYYQGVPTSRRPFRLAPFRSPSGTTDCCSPRGSGELLLAGPSSVLPAGASILCLRLTLVETAGSPRFLGNPLANMPCSSTPADLAHQAITMARDIAFRAADGVGSAFSHLSRLNHTACSLAVYASQLGLLRSNTTQDSLPAGGQPWRGRTLTCWVASGGFHSVLQLTSFPPPRSSPGAPAGVTLVRFAPNLPRNGAAST